MPLQGTSRSHRFARGGPFEEGLREGVKDGFMLDYRNSTVRVKT